jgi:cyclic pyranopterin phosphate synthase
LHRLNVSLDTLDPDRFRQLARRDGLPAVLAGLATAKAVGFRPIKVNAVAVRGFVEHDVVPLAEFCRDHGFELRFIETMPIGADSWDRAQLVPAEELLDRLSAVSPLRPVEGTDPSAPAVEYEYVDGGGRVGVIASVTRPFCRQCNRLRLTADGKLRNCLFAHDETDVKLLLRDGGPDDRIADALRANVAAKGEGHEINQARYRKPDRTMHAIGG